MEESGDPDNGPEYARRELASQCARTVEAVKAVMASEKDHILQHSLSVLRDECLWCAREFGEEEVYNGK